MLPVFKRKKPHFHNFNSCYSIGGSSFEQQRSTWREPQVKRQVGTGNDHPPLSSLRLAHPTCELQARFKANKRILNPFRSATKVEAPLQGSTIYIKLLRELGFLLYRSFHHYLFDRLKHRRGHRRGAWIDIAYNVFFRPRFRNIRCPITIFVSRPVVPIQVSFAPQHY